MHDMGRGKKSCDSSEELKEANERRIDQLIDVVKKHTRTERHLEQNMEIASLDDVKHALEIQREREEEIENLKNIVAYGNHDKVDELKNLHRNYSFTNNYLIENSKKMDRKTLKRVKLKQNNRLNHMDSLGSGSFK